MSAPALPRNHDDYEALAVAWAINALEPAEQAIFEAHRAGCEDCTRIASETLDVAAELAYGVPDVAPPSSLRARLLTDAVAARPQRAAPEPRLSPTSGRDDSRRSETRPTTAHDVPARRRHSAADTHEQEAADTHQHGSPEPPQQGASDPPRQSDQPRQGDEPRQGEPGRQDPPRPDNPRRESDQPRQDNPRRESDQPRQDNPRRESDQRRQGDQRRPGGVARPGGGRWLRGRRRVLAAALAAVLVGGSAVTTWQIVRTEQAAPADRVAALSSGAGTVATVVAHGRGADVVTDSLPPNDGTAYYVWGVPAGGDPQVVGTFVVTAAGLHSYPMRMVRSLSGYPVLAVSEEPAGSTPTAPSSVIGKGSLGG